MCDFCTRHGDGKVWYKNAANYAKDLASDINRRRFIRRFFNDTIKDGFETLGRLEALFQKKGKLPDSLKKLWLIGQKLNILGRYCLLRR